MSQRLWINKYASVAILLMLVLTLNPELRAFLALANFIGLDLMILLIAIQLRYMLPAVLSTQRSMGNIVCVASYATLRVATRGVALLLVPVYRATAGVTTFLYVLSKNLWCPMPNRTFDQTSH